MRSQKILGTRHDVLRRCCLSCCPWTLNGPNAAYERMCERTKNGKANVLGFVLQTNDDEIMNGKAVRWVAPGF